MRSRAELTALGERLGPLLRGFVRDSGVRIALLVDGSGQVLAQHGFTRSVELRNVASLAASGHAAARALADLTGSGRWRFLHHQGRRQQLVLAPMATPAEDLVLVTIFDGRTTLGLARLFCERLAHTLAELPELRGPAAGTTAERFEGELEAAVEQIFGPGGAERDPHAG